VLKLRYLKIDKKLIYIKYLILIVAAPFFSGCMNGVNSSEGEEYLLGTICRISIYETENKNPDKIIDDAFKIVKDIENRMSINIPDSEISNVNKNAGIEPVNVSPDILYLIQRSFTYSEISGGRFDITVGPLVELWGIGTSNAMVPSREEIKENLKLTDFNMIDIDADAGTVFLTKKKMMLDLGGIAKGFAADRVKEFLIGQGVEHAIIYMGGNILVIGDNPEKRLWKIGIQNPFMPGGTVMGVVEAFDQTIVTSGIYERYFIEDDVYYHHILDTDTGYPVNNSLASVTIITLCSTDADALSTAVFALGLEKGLSLIENLNETDAVFITRNREVYISSGMKDLFRITDESFIMMP